MRISALLSGTAPSTFRSTLTGSHANVSNIATCGGSKPNDENELREHELRYFLCGTNHNAVEHELVCPNWIIPPFVQTQTQAEPPLVLRYTNLDDATIKIPAPNVKGLPDATRGIKIEIPFLVFNANSTVQVKIIQRRAFVVLQRQRLQLCYIIL